MAEESPQKRVLTFPVLITGASVSGLGAQTALALATARPAHLILQGRSESRIQPVIDEIKKINPDVKATFASVDLSSIEDIRKGAAAINESVDHIDILINNAGIMAVKDFTKSVDGIESQFATNHIGHFLLTNLILGKIVKAGKGARIVNLTSDGHRLGPFRGDDYNFDVSPGSSSYQTSRLTSKRTERTTTHGQVMANRKQQTSFSHIISLMHLHQKEYTPSQFIPASFGVLA